MAKLTHEDILAYLEEATILELNDLVSAIEEKFGVTAAAPVAAAPAAEAAEAAGYSTGVSGQCNDTYLQETFYAEKSGSGSNSDV